MTANISHGHQVVFRLVRMMFGFVAFQNRSEPCDFAGWVATPSSVAIISRLSVETIELSGCLLVVNIED